MANYLVNRVFTKRETAKSDWSGRIGAVNLEADVASVKIDGVTLPEASVEYLLNFALQSLQDAYAGAASIDEATANWDKKRVSLLAGTIGVRTGEAGMTDEERAELYVAEAIYAGNYAKGTAKGDEFRALKGDDKTEFLVEKLPRIREVVEDFDARVAARVAHVEKMRAQRAGEKKSIAAMGPLDI